jgi:hypothetical protein
MTAPKRQQGQSVSAHDKAIDDYIASLEAENGRLREALRPFAEAERAVRRGREGMVDRLAFVRAAQLVPEPEKAKD